MYVLGFLLWLALAGLVGYVANERNRNPAGWAFISILFSPLIGLLALIAAGDSKNTETAVSKKSTGSSGTRKKKAWEKQSNRSNITEKKRKCVKKNGIRLPADYEKCPACHKPVDNGKHPLVES
ncbi:putative paraquat-inducible protein A [Salinibacter ruber]|uniref:AbrB family transcriptional regulator n=1 Tax=Salinibacter ruber TaxID=146919 RepID=UPI00216A7B04|nr:AbrB family transcriptional regulator [Salinibacter ruber]MCS3829513.1 putative paraquat-inducible protein A [Salinibacter ruber]